MKKYELTSETKTVFGITLYRIRALKSFGDVSEGELGGFIEKEENISQLGDSWVFDDAQVFGDARVDGNAQVFGNAWVGGDARVDGNAKVFNDAWVCGDARVDGNAQVFGNAWVGGDAQVFGNAWVGGDARVDGNAKVFDDAQVFGNAWVCGDARVCGNYTIFWISNIGSRNGTTTFFLCQDKIIRVSCGCFFGTLDEFDEKVRQTHGDSRYGEVYRLAIEMAKKHIIIPGADR